MKDTRVSCPRCHSPLKLPARKDLPPEGTCPRCGANFNIESAPLASPKEWNSAALRAELDERFSAHEARMDALAGRIDGAGDKVGPALAARLEEIERRLGSVDRMEERIAASDEGLAGLRRDLDRRLAAIESRLPDDGIDREELKSKIDELTTGLSEIQSDLGHRSERLREQLETLRRSLEGRRDPS